MVAPGHIEPNAQAIETPNKGNYGAHESTVPIDDILFGNGEPRIETCTKPKVGRNAGPQIHHYWKDGLYLCILSQYLSKCWWTNGFDGRSTGGYLKSNYPCFGNVVDGRGINVGY